MMGHGRSVAQPSVNWVPAAKGSLAIDHRPKLRSLSGLARAGATHVLTLLSDREGAQVIGKAVDGVGLDRIEWGNQFARDRTT